MSKVLKVNKKLYFLFFIFYILIFSFISCSQNVPEITHVDYSVVFSYHDEESKPDVRLSLFVKNLNDVRRCERIKVHSVSSDYIWNTDNIKNISYGDSSWSGNVNFVVPELEKIPSGRYEISYINSDESNDDFYLDLIYDQSLYEKKLSDIPEYMSDKAVLNVAIYNSDGVLLFFGEKSENLDSGGDILNSYNNAVSYQDVWITNDKTVICILPEKKL